uniref:carbonyl reductase (NADPH) n=1 Tax=Astyanax mexicanus TaxID=7994 RepID=A0A3B1K6Y7_ASTMX
MSGKVAVVTGANKGIGLAVVRAVCEAGFDGDVVLTARSEQLGREAVQQIRAAGHRAVFHQLDITSKSIALELQRFLKNTYGGLDVLINNAGIAYKNNAPEPFGEQAEVTMRTNFWGTLWVCQALFPILKPNARVVNVSSFVSKRSLDKCSPELQAKLRDPAITEEELCSLMNEFVAAAKRGDHESKGWANTAYGISKVGVTVLSMIQARTLTKTRAGEGILLNACNPGWVRTDMAGQSADKTPEEGAETPVYLALLPEGAKEPHGRFLSDKKVEEW